MPLDEFSSSLHASAEPAPKSVHLFCRVVDNYGDIGICWRLSRQFQREHGIAVTLWVDDLASFHRICPEVSVTSPIQQVAGVAVRQWTQVEDSFSAADIADIVIEFFACDIPEAYIAAMATCQPRPVWLNLEGLTAEEWVEGCHTLPSPHPRMPLTKHFFFPGFTAKTGGLLHESALEEERERFQGDPAAISDFLAGLGLTPTEQAGFKVSLFCYPHAPVAALFEAWQSGTAPVTCLVPEGVAREQVQAFLGCEATAGAGQTKASLTVRVLPFLPQPDYDKLLWACDFNFVRGEDSFVRAQWACKPFIWHIYPQDENLHHKKLRAFLKRYALDLDTLTDASLGWNDAVPGVGQGIEWQQRWSNLFADMPKIANRTSEWSREMLKNGDLTSNLLRFSGAVLSANRENKL